MITTQAFRVVRVLGGHSPVARIDGVGEDGHEIRIEVSADAARDASPDQVLVVNWSLHALAPARPTKPELPAPDVVRSENGASSLYLELFLDGVGSSLNLARCVHTLLASGTDPQAIRHHVNRHLRRSMASDAALMQELADAPDKSADAFPGTTDDFTDRVFDQLLSRVRNLLVDDHPPHCEIRLTLEEAAAGCVLAATLGGGPAVDLVFPAGTRDGQKFRIQELVTVDPRRDVEVVARVVASHAGAGKAKPGRVNGQNRRRNDEPPTNQN